MRVVIYLPDSEATGHYRLVFPGAVLQAQGADVILSTQGPQIMWNRGQGRWKNNLPPPDAEVVGLAEPPDADVVVIQRPARKWWADIIPHIQEAGIGVVVDLDDRLDRVHMDNYAKKQYDPNRIKHRDHDWTHADRACRLADVVTVTTPALRERFGYGHCTVLPNLVPEHYLRIDVGKKPQTVGWSGTLLVHPEDLHSTRGGVRTALDQTGWHFHVIGPGDGVKEALNLADEPSRTGFLPLDAYPISLSTLEIGIVPLKLDVFNESKSALKMGEMAALGVPVIASPTPDNARLHNLGVGELAMSQNQWAKRITALAKSADYRSELAGVGREIMATQTYERHAERWLKVWSRAARRKADARAI